MSAERGRPRAPLLARAMLWGVLALLYVPLITMFFGAWRKRGPDGAKRWTTEWFVAVFQDADLASAFWRSLLVALVASLAATVIGAAAAVALGRTRFPGKAWLRSLALGTLTMPELVFALSLLSWFVLLKIDLSVFTVITAHITFCIAYVMLTVTARLELLDVDLPDAARDLGASEAAILWRVIVPLLAPAILAGFLLSFLLSFDDFLITFYTTGPGFDTLPIKLYTMMRMGLSPKLNALASLMFAGTLAVIGVLWKLQRHILR